MTQWCPYCTRGEEILINEPGGLKPEESYWHWDESIAKMVECTDPPDEVKNRHVAAVEAMAKAGIEVTSMAQDEWLEKMLEKIRGWREKLRDDKR